MRIRAGWLPTLLAAALPCAAMFMMHGAAAAEFSVGALRIADPWTRATPKGATVAGGYMTITNGGSAPDRLLRGAVAVADRFELHSMATEQGVVRMRPMVGGLPIKPGERVELKPGAAHAMLIGLKQPLQPGQRVKGTLEFEHAGKVEIEYTVEALGAAAPAGRDPHRH
jgi:copper(I)-binding protein